MKKERSPKNHKKTSLIYPMMNITLQRTVSIKNHATLLLWIFLWKILSNKKYLYYFKAE